LENNKQLGKVLTFEQPSDFYYRKGLARQEEGAYLEALPLLRRACEQEGSNALYRMQMARLYAAMGCYEQSNQVLLDMLWQCGEPDGEYFYLLGCNFIEMHRFDMSVQAFKQIDLYYEDVDGQELQRQSGEDGCHVLLSQSIRMIEAGQAQQAVELLENAVEKGVPALRLQSALALAYYCAHEYRRAEELCNEILQEQPADIHPWCIYALICHRAKKEPEKQQALARICAFKTEDTDELERMAFTLCELGEYKSARPIEEKLLRKNPYSIRLLHRSAVTAYRLGDYESACERWAKVCRILPDDPIAAYYLSIACEASQDAKPRKGLEYAWALPADQAVENLTLISRAKREHQPSEALKNALEWAVLYGSENIQNDALRLFGMLFPRQAESVLRSFIVRFDQSDSIKRAAFETLKMLGAEEPYMALLNGSIVEVRVNALRVGENLPESYTRVIESLLRCLLNRGEKEQVGAALNLWETYIRQRCSGREDSPEEIRNINAYAAAVEYLARRLAGGKILSQQAVCDCYGISPSTMRRAMKDILSAIESEPAKS
jgi:tetratricopeptide (TPR) repeat protein